MNKIDPELKRTIISAVDEVKKFLTPLDAISEKDARKIIKRYTAAIEGNFVSWMGGTSISVRSVFGRYATDENLLIELKDDHPGMLRDFARSCEAEPNSQDFQYVDREVKKIRNLVGELSGLKNVALMATLENTSLVFIPWLSELAKKLGCKNLAYTDIHGEVDILHAEQFLEALTNEQSSGYVSHKKDISLTCKLTVELLNKIFAF